MFFNYIIRNKRFATYIFIEILKNLINVYMLYEEIFILNQSDVLVYNLKEKKFIEIDKNDSLLNEESQNPII